MPFLKMKSDPMKKRQSNIFEVKWSPHANIELFLSTFKNGLKLQDTFLPTAIQLSVLLQIRHSMDTINQEAYLSLLLQTSSISIALSAREAWVTHFSTTLLKIEVQNMSFKKVLKTSNELRPMFCLDHFLMISENYIFSFQPST